MNGGGTPPSRQNPQIFNYVQQAVQSTLASHQAWPRNYFQLRLEDAGIFQDHSGPCLRELQQQGGHEVTTTNDINYITQPGGGTPDQQIQDATEEVYRALQNQDRAFFAELAVYVGLAKVYEELTDYISIDVHPKGNYPRKLRGVTNELDGLLELWQENFPVEVHNGHQYITDNHSKIGQITNLSFDDEPVSNPLLVCRLSSENARKEAHGMNGTIFDVGDIVACELNHPDLADAVNTLDLSNHFVLLPELTTADGYNLDGATYHRFAKDYDLYERVTPRQVAPAADELPDSFLRRIRGGLHLLYVNTFYRRMSDPVDEYACLVLQPLFHHLLRQSNGVDLRTLLDIGWQDFRQRYPSINAQSQQSSILDRTRELVWRLRDENIVYERGGDLYARASDHPHTSLSFP